MKLLICRYDVVKGTFTAFVTLELN